MPRDFESGKWMGESRISLLGERDRIRIIHGDPCRAVFCEVDYDVGWDFTDLLPWIEYPGVPQAVIPTPARSEG